MSTFTAWSADEPKGLIQPVELDTPALQPDEVLIDVAFCGLCHSDYSMWTNEWGFTSYPFVGGHEVVGTVAEKGSQVTQLEVGQTVGVGWVSRSDLAQQAGNGWQGAATHRTGAECVDCAGGT